MDLRKVLSPHISQPGVVNLSRWQPDFTDENEYEWLLRLPVPS